MCGLTKWREKGELFKTVMNITKKNLRITLGAVLATLLIVVLLQNSSAVTLSLIVWKLQMPLFVVVLLSAVVGLGIGWLLKARRQ